MVRIVKEVFIDRTVMYTVMSQSACFYVLKYRDAEGLFLILHKCEQLFKGVTEFHLRWNINDSYLIAIILVETNQKSMCLIPLVLVQNTVTNGCR